MPRRTTSDREVRRPPECRLAYGAVARQHGIARTCSQLLWLTDSVGSIAWLTLPCCAAQRPLSLACRLVSRVAPVPTPRPSCLFLIHSSPLLTVFLTSHTRRWGVRSGGKTARRGRWDGASARIRNPRAIPVSIPGTNPACIPRRIPAKRYRVARADRLPAQTCRANRATDRAPRGGSARGTASVPTPQCCRERGAPSKLAREAINACPHRSSLVPHWYPGPELTAKPANQNH